MAFLSWSFKFKFFRLNKKQPCSKLAFENCVFSVINRPTRITKASATAIDYIFTNTILDFEVEQ